MNQGWTKQSFEDCIERVTYTQKIQRKDFLDDGAYPIVSQEEDFINGYWDNEADLFRVTGPVIVFGDHTKVLKYVDFDFVLGADGVKILQPRAFLLPKFFFYRLQAANLDSLGYARHYKLLKELEIAYPARPQQQRIVGILDEAFEGIATAKANAEKNLKDSRLLFLGLLNDVLSRQKEVEQSTFGKVVTKSRGGISIKSTDYSAEGIPVLTKGDVKPLGVVRHGGKYVPFKLVETLDWPRTSRGDLIVTTRDLKPSAPFLGLVAHVPAGQNYVVNQGATFFAVDEIRVSPKYFVYWCCSDLYREHVRSKRVGSTQVHIRQEDLFSAPLWLPPLSNQGAIANLLDAAALKTSQLAVIYRQKIIALETLKKSLLHHAFTGRL